MMLLSPVFFFFVIFVEDYASTDVLWKQNEPYFRFISDEDMSFLNKEVR